MTIQGKAFLPSVDVIDVTGVSVVNGALSAVTNVPLTVANCSTYWLGDFYLTATAAVALTQGSMVGLYMRLLNVNGPGNHEPAQSLTNKGHYVGAFTMAALTTQTKRLDGGAVALPQFVNGIEAEFQLWNQNTGQTLTALNLVATPFTANFL